MRERDLGNTEEFSWHDPDRGKEEEGSRMIPGFLLRFYSKATNGAIEDRKWMGR